MKKRILIVDDDRDFVEAVEALLTANGFDTFAAHDGTAGIELARRETPDLITMDVMMTEDGEGLSTVQALTADPVTKEIPVILMTGIKKAAGLTVDFATGEQTVKVRTVLEKPVNPQQLLNAVKAQLEE